MLYVLWTGTAGLHSDLPSALSDYRHDKLKKLKDPAAARNSLAVELLLQLALRRAEPEIMFPPMIEADENGKPFFPELPYRFSLSHSGHYAACALADFELGLDIQQRVECRESLVKRFFALDEQEEIFSSTDSDEAFSRIWCRKESFLKAIGLGLQMELASFSLAGERPEIRYDDKVYGFREETDGELHVCLCAENDRLPACVPLEKVVLA